MLSLRVLGRDEFVEVNGKRGKKVITGSFLDPGSPRLASSSPRPPNCLGVKEQAGLGEPAYFRMKHRLSWASCHGSEGHFLL